MPTKKTIEEIYQKKDLHQHILDRPDTYIGSTKLVTEDQYVFSDNTIIKKCIEYNPGLIKIFDEILVNAIDHSVRDSTVTSIKVNIDRDTDTISISNNGNGIPIVKHKQHLVYVPELIFGQLLTSSNYDDTTKRVVGGVNGIGGTCANIYSIRFNVETVQDGLIYKQEFRNNMFEKSEPVIKKTKKKSYTEISFTPDYKRFGLKGLTDDIVGMLIKRVYDCTACTNKNVSVYYNNEKLKQKEFSQYISLYSDEKNIYEKYQSGDYVWEYAVNTCSSPVHQVSFVNGIATTQGGRHVEYIMNQIIKKLTDMIQSKKKIQNLKPSYIKDKLSIFIRSTIVNPSFSSQSKEFLTTPIKDFGSKFEVSDQFITKIYKSGVVEDIISFANFKNSKDLQKTNGTTRKSRLRIPNLEDAHNAGTSKSKNCILILTEGLSAKTFAMSGLSVIGRENYGVYPLKGKCLNVREATQKQLLENEEINNLKQIIGLQHGKTYNSVDSLRYGSVCMLTDQDLDGVHIRCLLVNIFHLWWPELLDIPGFIVSMKTPIVKVSKGVSSVPFYTIKDFKDWEKNTVNKNSWVVKYYKGLGTSTAKEAKDIFKAMKNKIVKYISPGKSETDDAINLAFEKKQSDSRKQWLQRYNFDMTLDQAENDVTYENLINKELIHFSMYDVLRSIPSICDGFKPSQRKVLYTLLKKNYTKEIKVAQLSASVAETTSYHHGEASLQGTIIGMAQDFTGSNNINLLNPNGQFGSRLTSNGSDAASPRYIYTELNSITKKIFNQNDLPILVEQQDDGQSIEPLFFVPVIPMVLVNGAKGIGTGYSTSIPCYNPEDLITNTRLYLSGKKMNKLVPWYRGYKGDIVPDGSNFKMNGVYEIKNNKTILITEIPINVGIDDYKNFLDKLIDDKVITKSINKSTENSVCFEVQLDITRDLDIYKTFKLSKNISTKNFHLLNEKGVITKYESAENILIEFIKIRLEYNSKRKTHLIDEYNKELRILKNKIRFLREIIDNVLQIYNKPKDIIEKILVSRDYDKIENSYMYLISMPIHSFTKEKIESLNTKHDSVLEKISNIKSKTKEDILLDDIAW